MNLKLTLDFLFDSPSSSSSSSLSLNSNNDLGDLGPVDVIRDLHAKFEAAVNKAENVAQSAVQDANRAINVQENQDKNLKMQSYI